MHILLTLLSTPEFYVGLALGAFLGCFLVIAVLMLLGWLDERAEEQAHATAPQPASVSNATTGRQDRAAGRAWPRYYAGGGAWRRGLPADSSAIPGEFDLTDRIDARGLAR